MLVEYLDKLKEVGIDFETAVTSQTTITKRKVVQCLQWIGQHHLADILSARQGEPGVVSVLHPATTYSVGSFQSFQCCILKSGRTC